MVESVGQQLVHLGLRLGVAHDDYGRGCHWRARFDSEPGLERPLPSLVLTDECSSQEGYLADHADGRLVPAYLVCFFSLQLRTDCVLTFVLTSF